MSESKIEWTDATWNPVTGCQKVSEGCAYCYAERMSRRLHANPESDKYTDTIQDGAWSGEVFTHEEELDRPGSWEKPRRVFVCSMSDLFHEDVPWAFIAEVFGVMAANPEHTFQVLTKRPARMASLLRDERFQQRVSAIARHRDDRGEDWVRSPIRNVWLGTSVEHQAAADERIPDLLRCPSGYLKFLSCEPLLEEVNLTEFLDGFPLLGAERHHHRTGHACGGGGQSWSCSECHLCAGPMYTGGIRWVITGGESGPNARPLDPDWILFLKTQVDKAHDTRLFVKQLGSAWARLHDASDSKGGNPDDWPVLMRVREFPDVDEEVAPRA